MSFRIENLLLQLFIKVAGLLPRARPEPVPLKGPLKGTAFRDPRLVGEGKDEENRGPRQRSGAGHPLVRAEARGQEGSFLLALSFDR